MAEKVVSPGVFTNEIDKSFVPSALPDIGAAIIGPTVKGPAGIPTVVNSYSEFQARFGDSFPSGSNKYTYFTSLVARNYLKHQSPLTVVRILAGSPVKAVANVLTGSNISAGIAYTGSAGIGEIDSTAASISFKLHALADGAIMNNKGIDSPTAASATITITDYTELNAGDKVNLVSQDGTNYDFTNGDQSSVNGTWESATSNNQTATNLMNVINTSSGPAGTRFTATADGAVVTATQAIAGSYGNTTVTLTDSGTAGMTKTDFTGGVSDPTGTNNLLTTGSKDNVRWEVTNTNRLKGTFNLIIRAGNDTEKKKQNLETWNNLSLDPEAINYIGRVVGDSIETLLGSGTTNPYLQASGSYPNKSKYVRVEVSQPTVGYLDSDGNVKDQVNPRVPALHMSSSLPGIGSGSFGGAFTSGSDGTVQHPQNFYENIADDNSQGYDLATAAQGKTAYENAINLLKNKDEYDINLLMLPGVVDNGSGGGALLTLALDACEARGDCFLLMDPTFWNSNIPTATSEAEGRDSSYGAMYWPWIKMNDSAVGRQVWVPPSVAMAGVYAFNDKIGYPWFAPAGNTRGVVDNAVKAERKLTHSNRDTLYESSINPIATFPDQGVVVWGQKTLQKKASALDRVNVRRLLIKVKKFIALSSRKLVFEQNTVKTRGQFLNVANPFLERVKAQAGLNDFRVVMDDSNNPPDIVDRNILYGQIFLQPTKTAEFIVLDFTVQPTGATFSG